MELSLIVSNFICQVGFTNDYKNIYNAYSRSTNPNVRYHLHCHHIDIVSCYCPVRAHRISSLDINIVGNIDSDDIVGELR